jgi:cytochrome c553
LEVLVRRTNRVVIWIFLLALCLIADPAHSQSNLDARRSPEEIFSDTCSACHRAPQELKPTNPAFLRKHYTTGARQAAVMAAYLEAVVNDPPATAALPAKSRRPSESVEEGGSTTTEPSLPARPMPSRSAFDEFEE